MTYHSTLTPLKSVNFYFIVNNDWCITYFYSNSADFFEFNDADPIGKSLWTVLPKPIQDVFKNPLLQAKLENHPVSFSSENLNSTKKSLEVEVCPIPDGLMIFLRDNTSEKEVEAAIQENLKTLALLTETANDLILKERPKEILDTLFKNLSIYLDLDVYFHYIIDDQKQNLNLMNFQGIPDSIAENIKQVELGEHICGCAARDKSIIIEEDVEHSFNPKVELIQSLGIKAYACHPLISHSGIIGTLSFGSKQRTTFTQNELELIQKICDQVAVTLERLFLITELQEKNLKLNASNDQLIAAKNEADKANKAKTDFLSMMSHELRTPLNSILGFAQLLVINEENPLNDNQKNKVDKILNASRHLLTLINEILDLVRIEFGKPLIKLASVDAPLIISESIKMIKPFADSKNIQILNHTLHADVPNIRSDAVRLNQIILNLLSNAIKYNQHDGHIFINCETFLNEVTITITDTGYGIPQKEQGRIFEPFYRSADYSSLVEGTGIGLSLVQQLVTEMGGSVGLESAVGIGSTFWIRFPIETAGIVDESK